MSKHDEFIFTSIATVMDEAVLASSRIGNGIETYPLSEYIMQSLFLKMTGFQEQKMKCLSWEMATHDFEYRRILLNGNDNLGEYSSYNAKNSIYKRLTSIISSTKLDFDVNSFFNKQEVLEFTINSIIQIFSDSNLVAWNQNSFDYFEKNRTIMIDQFLVDNNTLFKPLNVKEPKIIEGSILNEKKQEIFEKRLREYHHAVEFNLIEKYKILYNQRNRYAHNTLSYQQNLPTLKTLEKEDEESRNYFVWFAILLLIDEISIELYSEYKRLLSEKIY